LVAYGASAPGPEVREGRKIIIIIIIIIRYFTYILFSYTNGRYYIGHTEDIIKRLEDHNNGFCKSTKHGVPWHIVFTNSVETRGEAMKLENSIKKRGAKRYLKDIGVI
jgi:putative endonuclease